MTTASSKPRWLRVESLWPTSLLFSFLLLGGYRVLESHAFLLLIVGAALCHLFACIRFAPRPSAELVLTQTVIAVATIAAVVLHVVHAVGPPPPGIWRMVGSFAAAEVQQGSTYLYFGSYLLIFALAVGGLLLVARALKLRSEIRPGLVLSTAYALSAVNLGFEYSLIRPLYRVSGEPGAEAFYFAAGLFGLEFSLPLHLSLLLSSCAALYLTAASQDRPEVPER